MQAVAICQYKVQLETIKDYNANMKIQDEEIKKQRSLYDEEVVSDFPRITISIIIRQNYF